MGKCQQWAQIPDGALLGCFETLSKVARWDDCRRSRKRTQLKEINSDTLTHEFRPPGSKNRQRKVSQLVLIKMIYKV